MENVRLRLPVQEGLLQLVYRESRKMYFLLSACRKRPADRLRAETCVGRIRYMGVMLYDADRVKELASLPNEEDLYAARKSIFLDPNDPNVEAQAEAGISHDWIEAAKKSPICKMICKWGVALPLHPGFRTLPMVWYVPPLSPIAQAVDAGKLSLKGRSSGCRKSAYSCPVLLANLLPQAIQNRFWML